MAFEIVDGMTGTKHISSDDLSALNVAIIGKADCVLKYGDDFKLTMASANSATLGTGVGMVGGKRFWNQAATSLTIQSGTQGQKRNDLVVARYAKTSAGIESITPVVIKGTPTTGTAADPEVTANDLKLWRVPLNGISVGEPVKLFEPVASLATIGDSVSQTKLLWSGSVYGGGSFVVPELKEYTFVEVVMSNADANHWGVLCFNDINAMKPTDKEYCIWVYADIHAGLDFIVSIKSQLEIQEDLKTITFKSGYECNIMKENTTVTSRQKLRIIAIYGVR